VKRLLALALGASLGLTQACTLFDRELREGRAYPCLLDAGEDPPDGGLLPDGGSPQCTPGWRCGREPGKEVPVCHRRGDERAYVCVTGAECEGAWTCGVEGLCIPPVDDAFKPGADETAGSTVERVSQSLLVGTPDGIAAVPESPVFGSFHGSAMGFVTGDTFTAVLRSRLGPPMQPTIGNFDSQLVRTQRGGGFKDVAGSTGLVEQFFALTGDGAGYLHIDFTDPNMMRFHPEVPYQAAWPSVRQEHLRLFAGEQPAVYAFGDGGIVTELFFPSAARGRDWPRDAGVFPQFTAAEYPPEWHGFAPSPVFPIRRVDDLTAMDVDAARSVTLLSADGQLLYAERVKNVGYTRTFADDAGYRREPFDGGPQWYPLGFVRQTDLILPELAGGYVFDDAGYTTRRVHSSQTRFAVELLPRAGSAAHVMIAQLFYGPPPGSTLELPFATVLLAPCAACPPGFDLRDFRPFIPPVGSMTAPPSIEARCTNAAGAQLTFSLAPAVGSSGCSAQLVGADEGPSTLADAVLPEESLVGGSGWLGAHGQMWLGESLFTAHALFLDGVPAALVRGGAEVAAFKDHTVFFLQPAPYGFIAVSGLGAGGVDAVASMAGRDDWVLIDELLVARQTLGGFGSGDELVARPGRSIDPSTLKPPFFGAVAATADGGHVAIATANDALFSGDVSAIYANAAADAAQMDFRHIPLNRVPIRSLAALDAPADGGAYARGFVLAGPNLIEFTASDEESWKSRVVPRPPGTMLEVWSDGDRGRLGYSDGRVYSLPGLKLLGPPMVAPVYDYFQFKAQPWAIAADGVWRLRGGADAGLGEWYPAAQPPADAGVVYPGARFFEAGDALYLFTVHGVVVRYR